MNSLAGSKGFFNSWNQFETSLGVGEYGSEGEKIMQEMENFHVLSTFWGKLYVT